MEIDVKNASVFYVFKPVLGYRTFSQLEKKLKELKKKDKDTTPLPHFAGSVPQIRDFAEYIQSDWWQKREFQGLPFRELLDSEIQMMFFRSWAKVSFSPGVDERVKDSIYRAALEVELVVVPE